MKKLILLTIGLSLALVSHAQNKSAEAEKEAKRIFQVYSTSYSSIVKNKGDKKAVAEFGKLFESGDVSVSNDFDSTNHEYVNVRAFLGVLQKADTSINITTSIKKINPLRENLSRNYDENAIDFTITFKKTTYTKDSTGAIKDSTNSSTNIAKTLLIRYDENMAGNLVGRIVCISDQGKEPKLSPLHKEIAWWTSLSPEWKKILGDKNALRKYPNVKDIENLAFTFDLDLSSSKITDIKPLSKIKELRKLNISNTAIDDITPLDSCRILGELNISNSKVRDITTIAHLKSLRKLYMNNLELKDITPVAGLTKLLELEASDNQINDLSPLSKLENLEKLNLSVNKIFKIDPLKGLIKLTDLRLGKNEIEGIDALSGLTDLIRLDLFNNKVPSLVPIRNHIKIAFLYIDFNPIKDLSPISRFGYLTHLSIEHTPIMDLSPISNSTTMSYLNIVGTEIASLSAVDKFNVIKEFKMFHTKISKNEAARYAKNHPGCRITYY